MARTKITGTVATDVAPLLPEAEQNVIDAQHAVTGALDATRALAVQMGYQGALTVGALEDEIRFYQRRTVEAILETGKRLLLLKEMTPHGEFKERVELLGFHIKTAQRFMLAAAKSTKNDKLSFLSTQVKSASAFLELVTHDDDVLENFAEMDDIERMSASEVRAALREAKAELGAKDKVLSDKNAANDRLRAQLKRVADLPADEELAATQAESTAAMNDALGAIRGRVRLALVAVRSKDGDHTVFMAGLVGQLTAELAALREEFDLPDVSNAAQQQLVSEMAQWANPQ